MLKTVSGEPAVMATSLDKHTPAPSRLTGLAPSRRQVAAGLAAAAAALTAAPPRAIAQVTGGAPPLRAKDWLLSPGAKPFDIPLDYLGIHFNNGVSNKEAAPSYPFDALRSHDVDNGNDMPATQWADIEVSPGTYDWKHADVWMGNDPGKTRMWVLFGTPKFYQKYPNEPFPFPTLPGGGSPPRDPKRAAEFVTALLSRYPNRIKYLEIWNEPNFGGGTNPFKDRWTPRGDDPGWFTGTAAELAALARAVRAVLPASVKLMAAGWAWQAQADQLTPGNAVLQYAAAPDGSGGFGRDHVQALSVHLYTYHFDPNAMIPEIRTYERLFQQAGYARTLERHCTECGAWNAPPPKPPGKFTEAHPLLPDKVRIVKRWCMIPAAMGYYSNYLYRHSDLGTLGDPAKTPAISAAIGEMRNGLRGKRLQQAAVLDDNSIWMAFADGTSLRA